MVTQAFDAIRNGAAVLGFLLLTVLPVWGGELSWYLKSGWFGWDEDLNGSSFVRERGALHGAGLMRRDLVSCFSFSESLEVWGGYLEYDGHDVTGLVKLDTDTAYLGSREEFALGVRLPAGEGGAIEPAVAGSGGARQPGLPTRRRCPPYLA